MKNVDGTVIVIIVFEFLFNRKIERV